jgi:hypothetical protein
VKLSSQSTDFKSIIVFRFGGHRLNSHYRILICYKNFSKECNVSHIGLGVTAAYTAKTLVTQGYDAQARPIFGADDLWKFLEAEEKLDRLITHVVICAQWIPTIWLAKLCRRFIHTKFALNCHSNVAFLQAEPPAISKVREAIDLESGVHNFYASGNNLRFCHAVSAAYDKPITFLPNLYYLSGRESICRPTWNGGTLRIGAFGSHRTYKNFSTAVVAAIILSQQLRVPLELWVNGGRNDGDGSVVWRTAVAWTEKLPNVELKTLPWATWPEFQRWVGSMHLLLQPSFTETFNNVTADGLARGTASVVSDCIDWVPDSWKADHDDALDVAGVARRLLTDPRAVKEGYNALSTYVEQGLIAWKKFLERR